MVPVQSTMENVMSKGEQKPKRENKKPKKTPEQKAGKQVSAYKQSLGGPKKP
jgi:hypothetical protein